MKDKKRVGKNQRKVIESSLKKSGVFENKSVKYENMEIRKSIAELRWQEKSPVQKLHWTKNTPTCVGKTF